MQIVSELQRYNSCTMWLESLRSKGTKKVYSIHLSLFCKFHNVTPDRLLELNDSVGQIKTMILDYIIQLKKVAKKSAGKPTKGQISVNSIKLYLNGIKSFFEFNEITLPWNKITKFYPDVVSNSYRSYTKDEITKLLAVADPRDRCVILLMASSGIRVGAIPSLKINSIRMV